MPWGSIDGEVPANVETLLARLTADRAALIDNLDRLDVILSTRLALIDYVTERGTDNALLAADYMTERGTDNALLAADYMTERGTDNALLAADYMTEKGTDLAFLAAKGNVMELAAKFPSAEALDDIAATGAQTTTEKEITVALPSGATINRVLLAAFITVMNDSENAHKIDVDVKGRPSGGSWSTFFSEDDVIGFPAVDGATVGLVPLQDVSALVTAAGIYGFQLSVTQSSANSVHYTTQYVLIVTYKMS